MANLIPRPLNRSNALSNDNHPVADKSQHSMQINTLIASASLAVLSEAYLSAKLCTHE